MAILSLNQLHQITERLTHILTQNA